MRCRGQDWAQVTLVLLALVLAAIWCARAIAAPVEFCPLALEPGQDCFDCAASSVTAESSVMLVRGVCVCPADEYDGSSACGLGTQDYGVFGWTDELRPGDGVFDNSLPGWRPVSQVEWWGWSPSSGGGEVDIDLETVARGFGAGFMLLAAFWALGKGVELVIRMAR